MEAGEVVDTAIYEAVFSMLEGVVPEYAHGGQVRGPSGSTITGVAPSNIYPTLDGKHVIIGANGESLYRRLCGAMGREDLLDGDKFGSNPRRWRHREELDGAIGEWTASLPSGEVLAALQAAAVPVGGLYDAEDMVRDPHFRARGMIQEGVPAGDDWVAAATEHQNGGRGSAEGAAGGDDGGGGGGGSGGYTLPGMCPVLQNSPGRTLWAGPALGSSTREVLGDVAGFSAKEIDDLLSAGAVLDAAAAEATRRKS